MTSKEIEIAKEFKKLGLEWQPEVGDKYARMGEMRVVEDKMCIVTDVRLTMSDSWYVTSSRPSKIASGKYIEWIEASNCVYFPDISRCFEELVERNCFPQLSFFDIPHKVDGKDFSYYSVGDGFVEGKKETGLTPREAMYKLLIEVMEAKGE